MVTKKLLHDIVTFCNNYIDNENIIFDICKYPTFISLAIQVWVVVNRSITNKENEIFCNIHDEKEFIRYKELILEKLPKLLEQVKEN